MILTQYIQMMWKRHMSADALALCIIGCETSKEVTVDRSSAEYSVFYSVWVCARVCVCASRQLRPTCINSFDGLAASQRTSSRGDLQSGFCDAARLLRGMWPRLETSQPLGPLLSHQFIVELESRRQIFTLSIEVKRSCPRRSNGGKNVTKLWTEYAGTMLDSVVQGSCCVFDVFQYKNISVGLASMCSPLQRSILKYSAIICFSINNLYFSPC